ncbi:MAG: hypothetical protein WCG85_22180, partial [Polyangia bacterium]
ICSGPDGNVWFTEDVGKIGRITMGGVITEFQVPTTGSTPRGIAPGPDVNLWFVEYGGAKIGRITPSGTITEFAAGTSKPSCITAGPDGRLWFTAFGNVIGAMTTSGVVTGTYSIPTSTSQPTSITTGADGNLWFTERSGNNIGRITPAGVITEFATPTPSSSPYAIAPGPDGNLWFTENAVGKIGQITQVGVITEFSPPSASSQPFGIVAGGDGNIWFAEFTADKIGQLLLPRIDGTCGEWGGQSTPPPAPQLCRLGMPSALSGAGPWTWICTGVNGGVNATCPPNTLPGSAVTVSGSSGRSVSFAQVTSAGDTSVVADPSCTNFPAGLLTGADCTNVTTTASYDASAGVQVCLPLPQSAASPVTIVQCDLVASGSTCPPPGSDARITTPMTGAQGQSLCCGQLPVDNPGHDPACATTHGLSLFAIGQSAQAAPVPALPPPFAILGALGLLAVAWRSANRG